MRSRIISDIKELKAIQGYWNKLFESGNWSVFQSFEFNYCSWEIELSNNRLNILCVVLLQTDRMVDSILPLYIDSKKRLRFINDKHADFCDVLSKKEFDLENVLLQIRSQFNFKSVYFINLKKESFFYVLYKKTEWKNTFLELCDSYSELVVPRACFPDKMIRYKSKQKTEFRRVRKKNVSNDYQLFFKETDAFPIEEIYNLKEKMISLGLRKGDFLNQKRFMLLESLYNANKLLVSIVRNDLNVCAISFILKNKHEYLFWIDMYDNSKMTNIYNYILFIENISSSNSVKINFGRGLYYYKVANFNPDTQHLFSVYMFRNKLIMLIFLLSNKLKRIAKSIYKKMLK